MTSYVTPKKNTAFIIYVGLQDYLTSGKLKANPTLAAGDAKVSIDGGAFANLTTLPTVTPAAGKGVKISLSAAEMNGDNITIVLSDQTSPPEWCDVILNIQTTASQIDDLALASSTTAAAIRAAVGMASANLDTQLSAIDDYIDTEVATVVSQTSAASIRSAVGLASANLDTQLAAIDDYLDTEIAAIKAKTDSLTFTVTGTLDVNVTNWKGSTAPAMTGDAYARLGAPSGASVSADIAQIYATLDTEIATLLSQTSDASIRSAVGLASANLDTQLAAIAAYVDTEVGTVVTQTTAASIRAAIGMASADLDTQLTTIAGYIDTEIGTLQTMATAIKAKTDNLPASPAATSDIPTANANADALLDRANGIETGLTLRQAFRLVSSVLFGKVSGGGTGTEVFRDFGDTKARITATVDSSGNRTAITRDAT